MRFKTTAFKNAEKKIHTISPFWDKCQEELGFDMVTNGKTSYSNSISSNLAWMYTWVEPSTSIGFLTIQKVPGDPETAHQRSASEGLCVIKF